MSRLEKLMDKDRRAKRGAAPCRVDPLGVLTRKEQKLLERELVEDQAVKGRAAMITLCRLLCPDILRPELKR